MVKIANSLCLDAFRSVNNEYGTFTRSDRTRDLVGEIDVTWGVYEVQEVLFAVFRVGVDHSGGLGEDCDSTLSFNLY